MTSTPYASVIVPTHDRAATLDLSIRSIQQQTIPDLEIVISGDGATPEVRELALSLADADLRIVFHDWPKAPQRGGENRDRAVHAAKAERIFYNDDDDLFLPNHVETLGPLLDCYDAVNDLSCSVSLSGRLQIAIANHSCGLLRDALASGAAKVLFDTHFAHRKSAYRRLADPWRGQGQTPVLNFFQAFAADPTIRWKSLPSITAFSFHGAARKNLSPQERRDELESWFPRLARATPGELTRNGHYDWYLFRLASRLPVDLAAGPHAFFASCHTRLQGGAGDATEELAVSLTEDQSQSLRDVFQLLRGEPVAPGRAAALVLRLADPLLGTRLQFGIIRLLQTSLSKAGAIEVLHRCRVDDPHTRELRTCLLSALLVRQGQFEQVEQEIQAGLKTSHYFRGDLLALAAELKKRQSDPELALDYAKAAISANARLRRAHDIAIWALNALGRTEAAHEARATARSFFADGAASSNSL